MVRVVLDRSGKVLLWVIAGLFIGGVVGTALGGGMLPFVAFAGAVALFFVVVFRSYYLLYGPRGVMWIVVGLVVLCLVGWIISSR